MAKKKKTTCDYCYCEIEDEPFRGDGMTLCEDCWLDLCCSTCPVCEEHYEKDSVKTGENEYFFLTRETAELTGHPVGMYRVLEHPFYYGDCVTGFDDFYDGAVEQVSDLDIEEQKRSESRYFDRRIHADIICPDCAAKYKDIRKISK